MHLSTILLPLGALLSSAAAAAIPTAASPSTDQSSTVLLPRQACKPIIMVYARGTWEPGNPPEQVAAPLIRALNQVYPGKVDPRILQYDGGATGYLLGGDFSGTTEMGRMIQQAAQGCPQSKILAVGYSQGAQVLHKAASALSANIKSHINAIVFFGDPNKGEPVSGISPNIINTQCFVTDMVCAGLPLPVGAHNQYDTVIPQVTQWIQRTLGAA